MLVNHLSVLPKLVAGIILAVLLLVLWYGGSAVEIFGYPKLAHILLLVGTGVSILAVQWGIGQMRQFIAPDAPSQKGAGTLAILFPVELTNVPWQEAILGSRSRLDQQVQVLILSGDGKWYVQDSVDYSGYLWQVEGYFGQKSGRVGEKYEVVAVETSRGLRQARRQCSQQCNPV